MLPPQQLSALLLRYEELRQAGHSISPEELCRDCPELVEEFRQRSAALAQVDKQLNLSTVDADDTLDSQKSSQPSTLLSIPGYVITHELARGGMGRVLGGREVALDREVAIKTLLPGSDATRFVTEAKITARLPHPSIPPVYALGKMKDGTPYLTMKLVRGETLADQLKTRSSTLHDLPRFLQIFEQIAQAVGFAHAQGIIHRDLKPANVMVGAFGEVQVMDWGLAKDVRSTATSLQPILETNPHDPGATVAYTNDTPAQGDETRSGAILGTPNYMAPEQARGEVATPQSDVFALGGILCAILTGKAVFGGTTVIETVKQAAAGDTAEVLRRLKNCGAETEVINLVKLCLVLNPAERPVDGQAVAKLVADYRQSVEGRLKKAETAKAEALVREAEQRKRRRQLLVAGAAVLLTLLAGLGVSLRQMNRAIDAEGQAKFNEQQARDERDAKDVALKAEQTARKEAETNLAYAKEGNKILGSVFEGLDPKAKYDTIADLRNALRDNLQKAVNQLEGSSIGDSLAVAKMQNTLGISLLGLGEPKLAVKVLENARETLLAKFGPSHPDVLSSILNLAAGYRETGKLDKAIPLQEQTLVQMQAILGTDHPDTLTAMSELAVSYQVTRRDDLALSLHKETLERRRERLGSDHPDVLESMNNLAACYLKIQKYDMALSLFAQTLTQLKITKGPHHPDTLTTMSNLAECYRSAGKLDQALPLLKESLKIKKSKLGENHPHTLNSKNNLAKCYSAMRMHVQALQLYEDVFAQSKMKLGDDHPETLTSMNNLASGYKAARMIERALPLYEETLKLTQAKLGDDHLYTLTSMNNLASTYQAAGKLDQALPLYEKTLKHMKEKLGKEHLLTVTTMGNLGTVYLDLGHGEKAATTLLEFTNCKRRLSQADSLSFAKLLYEVAFDLHKCEQHSTAVTLLRECLAIREKKEPDTWTTFNTQSMLGGTLLGQKKYAEAEPLLLKGYEGMKTREKTIPPEAATRISEALDRLIQLYTATNKPDEVKKWQAEKDKLTKAQSK